MSAGNQTADIDLRGFAKNHAIGIGQINLSIGVEPALDVTGILPDNAIEQGGVGIGLLDVDAFVLAYRKTLPVDDSFLATLINLHLRCRGRRIHAYRACNQFIACG